MRRQQTPPSSLQASVDLSAGNSSYVGMFFFVFFFSDLLIETSVLNSHVNMFPF